MFAVFTVGAQTRAVTGTVTGQGDSQPLPGVSIRLKGTQTGTQTDGSGKFAIQISGNNPVIYYCKEIRPTY